MRSIKFISSFFVLGYRPLGIIRLREGYKNGFLPLALPYLVKIDHGMGFSYRLPNYYELDTDEVENVKMINTSVLDGLLTQLVKTIGALTDGKGFFTSLICCQDRNVKNKIESELGPRDSIITAFNFPRRRVKIEAPDKVFDVDSYSASVFFSIYKVYSEVLSDLEAEVSKIFYDIKPEGYRDFTVYLNSYPINVPGLEIEKRNSDTITFVTNLLKRTYKILDEELRNRGGRFLELFVHALHGIRGTDMINAIEKNISELENRPNNREARRRHSVRSTELREKLLRLIIDNGLVMDRKTLEETFDSSTVEKFLREGLILPLKRGMIFASANGTIYPLRVVENVESPALKPVILLSEALHPVVDVEEAEIPEAYKSLITLEVRLKKAMSMGERVYVAMCPRTYYPYALPEEYYRLLEIKLGDSLKDAVDKVENEEIFVFDPISISSYIKGNVENELLREYLESIVGILKRRGEKIEIKFVKNLLSDLSSSPYEGIGELDEAFILSYGNKHYLTLVEIKRKKIQSPAEALIYYIKRAAHIHDIVDRIRGEVDNVKRLRFVFAFLDVLPRIPSYSSVYYKEVQKVLKTAESLGKLSLREFLEIYEKDLKKKPKSYKRFVFKPVYIWFLDILETLSKNPDGVLELMKEAVEAYNIDRVDIIDFISAYLLVNYIKNRE